jgi:hypothetical protein
MLEVILLTLLGLAAIWLLTTVASIIAWIFLIIFGGD